MGTGEIRLILGDARGLPAILDQSVHLVVTSPPYPMIPQWDALFASMGARGYDSMHELLAGAWRECHRVLVPGGMLALNIGDALRSDSGGFRLWPNHATVLLHAERSGFTPLPFLLWKKPTNKPNAFLGSGFLPPNAYVTQDCEFLLLLRKGGPRKFSPHDPVRESSRFSRGDRDRWFSQIWDGVRGVSQSGSTGRTAAFPPEIPDRLVRMFSCEGETVLDPFAGTGTTLWAAARRGRNAIGVERDPTLYEQLIRKREALPGVAPAPGGPSPHRRRS